MQDSTVLCASSAYERKYYLNPVYEKLPQQVKDELQIMCVLYTEDVGGTLTLEFDEDGSLLLIPAAEEDDILYDNIGSALKIHQLQRDKGELFEALERYYRVVICGEGDVDASGD